MQQFRRTSLISGLQKLPLKWLLCHCNTCPKCPFSRTLWAWMLWKGYCQDLSVNLLSPLTCVKALLFLPSCKWSAMQRFETPSEFRTSFPKLQVVTWATLPTSSMQCCPKKAAVDASILWSGLVGKRWNRAWRIDSATEEQLSFLCFLNDSF